MIKKSHKRPNPPSPVSQSEFSQCVIVKWSPGTCPGDLAEPPSRQDRRICQSLIFFSHPQGSSQAEGRHVGFCWQSVDGLAGKSGNPNHSPIMHQALTIGHSGTLQTHVVLLKTVHPESNQTLKCKLVQPKSCKAETSCYLNHLKTPQDLQLPGQCMLYYLGVEIYSDSLVWFTIAIAIYSRFKF